MMRNERIIMKSFFSILEKEFQELASLGYKVEENIFINPALAVIDSRLYAEKILEAVIKKENQEYMIIYSQFERIKNLNKEGILDDNIVRDFDDIRIIGNKAVHEGKNNDIEYSVRLHKKLYSITKWFFEAYSSDYSMQVPLYTIPDFSQAQEKISFLEIDNIIKQRIEEFIDLTQKRILVEEKGVDRDLNKSKEELQEEEVIMKALGYEYTDEILKEETKEVTENLKVKDNESIVSEKEFSYTYKKFRGSYLLNELSRLSTSSQEAVESSESLNPFKTYLHVKRSIQDELVELLKEANESDEAQLIFLCGSVGDGKSHLLAYINENYKYIVSNFEVHNDATESFDPQLTEIETLAKVLDDFSDENIEHSKKKLILAINLGVLNNFLEEDFVQEKYKKFAQFIDESGVFNQESIINEYKNNNFKLISFGNYNIYELTKDGPKSNYIKHILSKVVSKEQGNPFYQAYLKDMEEKLNSPIMVNYKILSAPGVVERVTNLIVTSIVKYKKLLGTRELLNFIYEILVPANIEEYDMGSSSLDYISSLLPNLLFNSLDRGLLLNVINKEDVLKLRDEKIDDLLIRLNIASDIPQILNEYVEKDRLELLEIVLGDIRSLNLLTESVKNHVVDTIIRLLYLIGDEFTTKVFSDESFKQFMIYLYYFNTGQPKEYKKLFDEIKEAVFNWNDYPRDGYIYLNERLENFKVAEKLELKSSKAGCCETNKKEVLERFKTNINIGFEIQIKNSKEILELDYQLYKKIVDINNGYYASKNDKEEAVRFVEFVDKLVALGNMETELLIEDKIDKKIFRLIYENDFDEEFKFERVD